MLSRRLIAIATTSALLAVPATANANVLDALYAPLHIHSNGLPSPSFVRSHFPTVTVTAGEAPEGIPLRAHGPVHEGHPLIRRPLPGVLVSAYPAGGARVRDKARGFYVMNPASSAGASRSSRPAALRPTSASSTRWAPTATTAPGPGQSESRSWWIQQTTAEANYVENASSRWGVVANNLITARNPTSRVGFEMFAGGSA